MLFACRCESVRCCHGRPRVARQGGHAKSACMQSTHVDVALPRAHVRQARMFMSLCQMRMSANDARSRRLNHMAYMQMTRIDACFGHDRHSQSHTCALTCLWQSAKTAPTTSRAARRLLVHAYAHVHACGRGDYAAQRLLVHAHAHVHACGRSDYAAWRLLVHAYAHVHACGRVGYAAQRLLVHAHAHAHARGRSGYAAQSRLAQLCGQHMPHIVHRFYYLVKRYQRFHAAQRKVGA